MNLSKVGQYRLLGGILALIVLIASWFLLLGPRMSEASEMRTQTESIEANLANDKVSLAQLQRQVDNFDDQKAFNDALSKRFPSDAAQAALFDAVRGAATDVGLDDSAVTNIGVGTPQAGNGSAAAATTAPAPTAESSTPSVGSMTLSIDVSAKYSQALAFIAAIEDMPRSFLIDDVSMEGAPEGGVFTVQVNGKMFLLPPTVLADGAAKQ